MTGSKKTTTYEYMSFLYEFEFTLINLDTLIVGTKYMPCMERLG